MAFVFELYIIYHNDLYAEEFHNTGAFLSKSLEIVAWPTNILKLKGLFQKV